MDLDIGRVRAPNNDPLWVYNYFLSIPHEKKSQEITDKERKHIIEALIVRIMKSRKKLDHNSLISEIFSQKLLFEPSIKLIKNSLESLIDREYIERNDENINEYSYIS